MFDEIVNNGNNVVITFNQLTDSDILLKILSDECGYRVFERLFDLGYIKISRFENIDSLKVSTASQYIQDAIKSALEEKDNFIFSSKLVEQNQKNLLKLMESSLVGSDLSKFDDYITGSKKGKLKELFCENENNINSNFDESKAIRQLENIRKYIKLILKISIIDNIYLEPKGANNIKMSDVIKIVCEDKLKGQEYEDIRGIIEDIKSELGDKKNKRSNWINLLKDKYENDETIRKVECIIDICYNYTLENNIQDISRHTEKIADDFFNRFKYEWENLNNQENIINKNPDWNLALRVIERAEKYNKEKSQNQSLNQKIPLYEDNYDIERKKQSKINKKCFYYNINYIIIMVFIGLIIDFTLSLIQDKVSFNLFGSFFENLIIYSVAFFTFAVINAGIKKFLKIGDIFDCLMTLKETATDMLELNKYKDNQYRNDKIKK